MNRHGTWMWTVAGPIKARIMGWIGLAAITLPWGRIWLHPDAVERLDIHVHERVHIEQIDRHFAFRFSVMYAWYLAKHGYRRNPFEVEAYSRQREWVEESVEAATSAQSEANRKLATRC